MIFKCNYKWHLKYKIVFAFVDGSDLHEWDINATRCWNIIIVNYDW
jgi:hypothetical protein